MGTVNNRWQRALGWVIVAALLAVYTARQVLPLLGDRGTGIVGLASDQNDFKHLYLGARLLNEGISPYPATTMLTLAGGYSVTADPRFITVNPYVYLPFTALVVTPLSWLPFATAVVVFQLINHVLVLGGLLLAAHALGWRGSPWVPAAILAATAFSFTLYRQNNAGQLNAVLLAGYALVFWLWRRGTHPAGHGALAAALALFKLSPGVLLFWMAARRDWRGVAAMAAAGAALMGVSLALYGWAVHREFLGVLSQMGFGRSTWPEYNTFWRDPGNISFNATWHRLLVAVPGGAMTPWFNAGATVANALTWMVALPVFGAMLWAVARNPRAATPGADAAFAVVILASLLMPSLLWDHYLVQALLAALILWPGANAGRRVAIGVALVIAAVPLPLDPPEWRAGAGLLMHSARLLCPLILITVGLWQALRPAEPTT
jgi:hypothetical protein